MNIKQTLFTNQEAFEDCPLSLPSRIVAAMMAMGAAICVESSIIYIISRHAERMPMHFVIGTVVCVGGMWYVFKRTQIKETISSLKPRLAF